MDSPYSGAILHSACDSYMLIECIGRGGYCSVWSATNLDGDIVAVKIYENAFNNLSDTRRILREITLVRSFVGCPRLVHVLDAITPRAPDSTSIALVFRHHGINLYDLLQCKSGITDAHVWHIIYQIVWALRALHRAGVVMGDMKLSNVLVDECCRVVLCDFNLSLARPLPDQERPLLRMTEGYRAPECMMLAPLTDELACAIDIWGLGCVFAELLLSMDKGRPQTLMRSMFTSTGGQFAKVFSVIGTPSGAGWSLLEQHQPKTAKQWLGKQHPSVLPTILGANPDAAALIEQMLAFMPAERPTAEMIYSLEVFADLRRDDAAIADIKEVDLSSIDLLWTEAALRTRSHQLIRAIQELRATSGYASDGVSDGASDGASESTPVGNSGCESGLFGFESLIETA